MSSTTAEKEKKSTPSVSVGNGPEGTKPPAAVKPTGVPDTVEPTLSSRFTSMIVREASAITGKMELSEDQKRLAQHLFVKIDVTLQALDAKRLASQKPDAKAPIVWANINMSKLALDAMHRIELGLDALVPNHIHPIPYFNSKTKKYDLDLRIGYIGKDYYRRTVAVDPPKDIRYELVYSKDKLTVFMKSKTNKIESYDFDVPDPFNRGDVVGGFAYLVYEDETKNKLVLMSKKDFDKSKNLAQTQDFWGKYEDKMQYKTLVTRATDKLQVDPKKVSAAYLAVENDDLGDAAEVRDQIKEQANSGEVIEVIPEIVQDAKTDMGGTDTATTDQTIQESASADEPKKGPGF